MNISFPKWIRISYGVILGVIFNFILDIIFSLVYKQYVLFQPVLKYISAVVITYITIEAIVWFNGILKKSQRWENHPTERFFLQLLSNSIIAIIVVDVLRYLVFIIVDYKGYINLFDELIIISYVTALVIIFNLADMGIYLLNVWRFNLAELERFKKENAEFRFEALRSQLNPHFLFNSLNTLSSLVNEDTKNATRFIRELADVYRYILDNREKELADFQREMDFANSYIQLNKLRFGDNFQVNIEVINNSGDKKIAPLTLQLLIENAIKHNIISKTKPLKIQIMADEHELIVSNNLQLKKTKEYSNNMGLKNIISRYEFLTDKKITITTTESEFIVKIPLI